MTMRVWCPRRISGLTCRAFARVGSTAGSHDRAHTGSGSYAGHSSWVPVPHMIIDITISGQCGAVDCATAAWRPPGLRKGGGGAGSRSALPLQIVESNSC